MQQDKTKKIQKYFHKPKDYFVDLLGVVGFLYVLNFGLLEILPDNLAIVGNVDEAFALFLIYSSAEYFSWNIKSIFKR